MVCLSFLLSSSFFFLLFTGTSETAVRWSGTALTWKRVQMSWRQCLKCCMLTQTFSPRNSSWGILMQKIRPSVHLGEICLKKILAFPTEKGWGVCENVPVLHPPVLATQQVGWRLPLSSPICRKQPPEHVRRSLAHLESLQSSSQILPEANKCSV